MRDTITSQTPGQGAVLGQELRARNISLMVDSAKTPSALGAGLTILQNRTEQWRGIHVL